MPDDGDKGDHGDDCKSVSRGLVCLCALIDQGRRLEVDFSPGSFGSFAKGRNLKSGTFIYINHAPWRSCSIPINPTTCIDLLINLSSYLVGTVNINELQLLK